MVNTSSGQIGRIQNQAEDVDGEFYEMESATTPQGDNSVQKIFEGI